MTVSLDFLPALTVFDFDGVIIDSAPLKAAAFAELFNDYPEHRETINDFHRRNSGISRFRQFDHIYRSILRLPLTPEEAERRSRRFSDIVLPKLMQTSTLAGSLEFILRVRSAGVPTYILSGTPHAELLHVVESIGIRALFDDVFGSPPDKVTQLKAFTDSWDVSPESILFIGDARSDEADASVAGVTFIGVAAQHNGFTQGTRVVSSLAEITLPIGLDPVANSHL